MEKLEKTFVVCATLAALGIAFFWFAGFNGKMLIAAYSLSISGALAWISIITKFFSWLQSRYI